MARFTNYTTSESCTLSFDSPPFLGQTAYPLCLLLWLYKHLDTASFINRTNLVSPETSPLKVSAVSIEDIEKQVIKERIASFKIDPAMTDGKVTNFIKSKLTSEEGEGESTANKLLSTLKKEKIENETVNDFEKRVIQDGKFVMGLSDT